MGIYVYVGNLGSSITEDAIQKAFLAAGNPVKSVVILRNPDTDRSRGFGFVELGSEDEAAATIRVMNGFEVEGRPLKLGQARERAPVQSDGRSFHSYSGLGGRTPGSTRRPGGGAKRKQR